MCLDEPAAGWAGPAVCWGGCCRPVWAPPGPLPQLTLPFLSSQMDGEAASLSRKGLCSFILK